MCKSARNTIFVSRLFAIFVKTKECFSPLVIFSVLFLLEVERLGELGRDLDLDLVWEVCGLRTGGGMGVVDVRGEGGGELDGEETNTGELWTDN